jgi:hypothetical protein
MVQLEHTHNKRLLLTDFYEKYRQTDYDNITIYLGHVVCCWGRKCPYVRGQYLCIYTLLLYKEITKYITFYLSCDICIL